MNEREHRPSGRPDIPEDLPWRWRNLRSLGLSVGVWPIEWTLGIVREDDQFGGQIAVLVGPLEFTLSYNDGSALRAKPN